MMSVYSGAGIGAGRSGQFRQDSTSNSSSNSSLKSNKSKNNHFKKLKVFISIMLTVALIIGFVPIQSGGEVNAERYASVSITVTQLYDYAYEVLDYVNEERAANGLGQLSMDEELLRAAMQRAAESVVNGLAYSNDAFVANESLAHTRPTGYSCFTVSAKAAGENIAMGIKNPFAVMFGKDRNINPNSSSDMDHSSWMRSSGHRSNILEANYKSVGIGVVYYGGSYYYYWSQEFGYDTANVPAVRTDRPQATFSVDVSSNVYNKLVANGVLSGENVTNSGSGSSGYSGTGSGTPTSLADGWARVGSGWKYAYQGYFVTNTWIRSGSTGRWYAVGPDEYMMTGWQYLESYYYYFAPSGEMASNEWRDGYWLSDNGSWTYQAYGSWHNNGSGWWFGDTSGWYACNQWQKINGYWYYFDGDGYMVTNTYIDGYYLGADGALQ
ncbi:MAG: hypothetical protein K6E10_00755 [Eubacterium sp.]|nr:hypothetical protein [Eubacterium sp.]